MTKLDQQMAHFLSDIPANELVETTLNKLSDLLRAEAAALWYVVQASQFRLIACTSDAPSQGASLPFSDISDVKTLDLTSETLEFGLGKAQEAGFLIQIPLRFRDTLIALVEVITPQAIPEDDEAFTAALVLCQQLCLYLTNADVVQDLTGIESASTNGEHVDFQKYATDLEQLVENRTEELEEERDRLDKLHQITTELARTLDMEQLLERALGMVSKAVGAVDGVIMLRDPATDNLYSRAWINPNHLIYIQEDDIQTHLAEGLAAWLIYDDMSGDNVVLIDDLHETDYWDERGRETGLRSAIAVILENNDDPMGVMVLLSEDVAAFTENHLKLLVPAATQVAASINSADLYQLIRDQAERMGKVLRSEQEEAQKNAAVLESIADGVMLTDPSGEVILFNNAAERILEILRANAIGQKVGQIVSNFGQIASKLNQMFEWSEISPDTDDFEENIVTERFEIGNKIILTQLSPVYIGELFLGVVSVFRDATESFRLEDMMRNQLMVAERSASILEGLQDGVIYVDVSGTVGLFNSRAEALLKVRRESVINKNIYWLIDNHPQAETIAKWATPIAHWTDSIHTGQELDSSFEYESDQQRLTLSMNAVYLGSEYLGSVTVIRV